MRSVKFLVAAGAASLLSSVAFAADMPSIMPPPPMSYAPPPVEDFGGWYLRGDIGFSNQRTKNVLDTNAAAYNNVAVSQTSAFGTAGIFDLGVGYRFNNWFRVDVTGQYRGNSNFTGLDTITGTGPWPALSAPTAIPRPSRNGSSSPTPMPISAPGGASRRSSAPASVWRAYRSPTSPTPVISSTAACRTTASTMPDRTRSGTSPGRCMPVLPTRSARA